MRVKLDGKEYEVNVLEKPEREEAEAALAALKRIVGETPEYKTLVAYLKKMALTVVVLGAMNEERVKKEEPIAYGLARELAAKPMPGTFIRQASEGEQGAITYLASKSPYKQ